MILQNGSFQLYRANFKANKIRELVNSTDQETHFTNFAFSPESEQYAVSNNRGEILVCKITDNFEIKKCPTKNTVHILKWLFLANSSEIGQVNPLAKNSAVDLFLPQIEAHKGSKEENIIALNLCTTEYSSYSILFSVDAENLLSLTLNGYFDIGTINLVSLLQGSPVAASMFIVHDLYVDKDRDQIAFFHSEGGSSSKNMYLSLCDFSFLRSSKETIIKLGIFTSYLKTIIKNLTYSLDSMAATLKTIERNFNTPFYAYEDLLAKEDRFKNLTPAKDMYRIIRTGELSASFQKFITESFDGPKAADTHAVQRNNSENHGRVRVCSRAHNR